MKSTQLYTLFLAFSVSACMSVPPETISLSRTISNDLVALHDSHHNMAEIQFAQIKQDINDFVDDIYAPFIINFVLKDELEKYKKNQPSLYGYIEAGKNGNDKEIKEAVEVMFEFQEAANEMIETKRSELLGPILDQEAQVLDNIEQSYDNVTYGSAAITNYLESVRKIKHTQGQALERVGLKSIVDNVNNSVTRVSTFVSSALAKGKEIDITSDSAFNDIETITKQIKDINQNQ